MNKWRNRIENLLEYGLAIMFIQGGIRTLLFADPVVLPGIFAVLVGPFAIYLYGVLFLVTGGTLLFAKWKKKKKIHKHTLMAMYMICLYVLVLALFVHGLSPRLLLTITVGSVAAYLWMRWTLRTEYLQPGEFHDDIRELGDR